MKVLFLTANRPLPDELIKYAREDTHYLLYIYDRMKCELLDAGNEQQNLLLSVLQKSQRICAKVVNVVWKVVLILRLSAFSDSLLRKHSTWDLCCGPNCIFNWGGLSRRVPTVLHPMIQTTDYMDCIIYCYLLFISFFLQQKSRLDILWCF